MLILSRNVGEILCVGDDVEITISEIHGNKVRLCIQAPIEISIDRKEIRELKDADKKSREEEGI